MQSNWFSINDGHRCHYCKRRMINYRHDLTVEQRELVATKDHKRPKFLGGLNEDENYAVACARCNNQLKAHLPYTVFKIFADMVLLPYPDLPLPILRNSLNLYIMHLLERSCTNKEIMRTASSIALLKLKDDIDEFEGKKIKTKRVK